MQEEVVCETDELLAFRDDWTGLSGGAEGEHAGALRVVVVYQELMRIGSIGECGQ
jgi:hypothetical protein